MTRKVKELLDLEIDEISLVDKGANQHAKTVIAKRHDEEDEMDNYFDQDGEPVDVASLEPGDVVYDEEGTAFEAYEEDEGNPFELHEDEKELAMVGKSFEIEKFREELSKALTDDDRDAVISKAFDQMAQYEEIAKRAEAAAEAERQIRLDREYIEVAKNYNVGVSPEDLGPVLKRAAEALSYEDCTVIAKALDSASAATEMFEEIGRQGGGSNSDVFQQVEAVIDGQVAKGDSSREGLISKLFDENPDAYDEYLAEQNNR